LAKRKGDATEGCIARQRRCPEGQELYENNVLQIYRWEVRPSQVFRPGYLEESGLDFSFPDSLVVIFGYRLN